MHQKQPPAKVATARSPESGRAETLSVPVSPDPFTVAFDVFPQPASAIVAIAAIPIFTILIFLSFSPVPLRRIILVVTSILYFHGFASSPTSRKLILLREMLRGDGFELDSPDLNLPSFRHLDWEAMIAAGLAGLRSEPDLLVGSSLGGLLAIDLARRANTTIPLVLISPALGFGSRWEDQLPGEDPVTVFRHATERDEQIHRAFFTATALREADRHPPPGRVSLLMGTADESVPPSGVRETWIRWLEEGELAAGSRLIEIAGADHSLLDHIDLIAREIRGFGVGPKK